MPIPRIADGAIAARLSGSNIVVPSDVHTCDGKMAATCALPNAANAPVLIRSKPTKAATCSAKTRRPMAPPSAVPGNSGQNAPAVSKPTASAMPWLLDWDSA